MMEATTVVAVKRDMFSDLLISSIPWVMLMSNTIIIKNDRESLVGFRSP